MSFIANQGQIDVYGDQRFARQCYNVTIIEERSNDDPKEANDK